VVCLLHDRLQLGLAGITLYRSLEANGSKAHLGRWCLQGSIGNLPGTPSSEIANVALQEQLQTGKFHLLPGGHGPDPLSGSGCMGRPRKSRTEGRGFASQTATDPGGQKLCGGAPGDCDQGGAACDSAQPAGQHPGGGGVSSGLGYLILDCRDRLAYGELTSVLFGPTAIPKPQGHTLMHLCILAFQHY
jgi:hypothetical protein